ncbi:Mitochondrial carrier [Trichuris trichiura]|uniref:Mitochondrial carrier n=1 Tax=Trichuris trichiura TaxID=36087 RepID=A0A077Z0A8_TRITR|nr:Mitochondrial carrier [Trichuris trichiura]
MLSRMGLLKLYPDQMEDNNSAVAYGNRLIASTLFHPLNYTKVLMQLGHEPMPLGMGRTMIYFGSERYILPNAIGYSTLLRCLRSLSIQCFVSATHLQSRRPFGLIQRMECIHRFFIVWHVCVQESLRSNYRLFSFCSSLLIFQYLDKRFPDKELTEEEAKTQFFDRTLAQVRKLREGKNVFHLSRLAQQTNGG